MYGAIMFNVLLYIFVTQNTHVVSYARCNDEFGNHLGVVYRDISESAKSPLNMPYCPLYTLPLR
jgi:hypothetical protein